jgi:hypothetical protein
MKQKQTQRQRLPVPLRGTAATKFKGKFKPKNKLEKYGNGWRSEDRRYKGNCKEPAGRRRYENLFGSASSS